MKNKGVIFGLAAVVLVAILIVGQNFHQNFQKVPDSELSTDKLSIEEKFSILISAKTNFCAKADFINYKQVEGLAKFLITEHGFSSEQIAEVWDLIDGCGGKGHAHEAGM